MTPTSEIEFIIDEQYENEKGVFTVLSIHKSEMVIRWESGEEIRTGIELQRNIQSRRQWEQLQTKSAAQEGKSAIGKGASARGVPEFNGLQVGDFKNTASGTKWRGRNQLGGEVTRRLPESRFDLNSWALGNKPEMHWLDTRHQKNDGIGNGAKFFVRVDHQGMQYGFSIVKPDQKSGNGQCWQAFMDWLTHEGNNRELLALAGENNLKISIPVDPQQAVLLSKDGAWCLDDGQKQEGVENISAFIKSLSEADDISIEIARLKNKKEALAAGKHIAEDIASLFSRLMPLYHAAWPVLV